MLSLVTAGVRVGLAALVLILQQQSLPPAYPRPGATSVLENEQVIVWNIAWLQQAYPMHRHRYDHVGVYYAPGDRVIVSPEGDRRSVSTPAWNISFQLAGVTHTEEGASAEPLRAVFAQIKRPPRHDAATAGLPADTSGLRLDNDRVTVWEHPGGPGASTRPHRHAHDAVVVLFDAAGTPTAHWVERGSMHGADLPPGAVRTFVFEIK
jgi:hypothetical protein